MSAADRLEDGFPHGTREGYDQGCRGSRCPATEDGWLSCAQARTRYQSDYAYRKRVDAGMTPAQLAEFDEREAAEQRAQLAAARARRDGVASAPAPESVEPREVVPAVSAEEAAAIASAERSGVAYERHGTPSGYSAGCRAKEACPGIQRVGKSCTDAVVEYQRELKARRRAAEAPAQVVQAAPAETVAEQVAQPSERVVELREQLAAETARADAAERDLAEAEKEAALLDQKHRDAAAQCAVLTDRVASLEMELDVAKASALKVVASATGVDHRAPVRLQPLVAAPSRFRFARDELGGVVVDVEGSEPGFVRFEVDEAGTLTGVAVQAGK